MGCRSEGGVRCLRIFVITDAILIWLIGGAIFGFSMWLLVDFFVNGTAILWFVDSLTDISMFLGLYTWHSRSKSSKYFATFYIVKSWLRFN